jgi:phosphatidylglycerophosphatase A
LLQVVHISTLFLLALFISVDAIKQINIYEKEVGTHDGKEIVIDELAGMWITLSVAGVTSSTDYLLFLLSFIFFRLFDIFKPSIIGKIDKKVEGGLGVMGDDIVAGIFAGLTTALTYQIIMNFI